MIFLDTTYLTALAIENDNKHQDATELFKTIQKTKEQTVINNTVLTESINFLSRCKKGSQHLENVLKIILNVNNIYLLNDKDYITSIEKYKYYGQSINFSDCTILQTMEKYKIRKIATFDSDFEKIKGIQVIR